MPAEQGSYFYKCKRDNKVFISKKYLKKHHERCYPNIDFYEDYKTEADFEKVPNPYTVSA